MRLGGVLLIICLLLIGTGCADGALRRARILPGRAAALCALALLLYPVEPTFLGWGALHPSSLILAAAGVSLAPGKWGKRRAALAAIALGVLGWFVGGMFPAAEETGALAALPTILLLGLGAQDARGGLGAALLMPLAYGLAAALEDWYLFDALRISFGARVQLDAQVCGAMGFLALSGLRERWQDRRAYAKFVRGSAKNS